MQLWMIERDVTGWNDEELEAAGLRAKMCLGWFPDVVWLRSYLSRERRLLTCLYRAPSEAAIREHAFAAALPVTRVWMVEESSPDDVISFSADEAERYAVAHGLPPKPI